MPYADKAAQRAYQRAHYKANKAEYVARARRMDAHYKDGARKWLLNYLLSHPCVDCGESDPIVLEFDHRPGESKEFNLGESARRKVSVSRIEAEVAKCDVRCANCHRRVTYRRAGYDHRG